MCQQCQKTPCANRCPNAPNPAVLLRCGRCGESIGAGQRYYDFADQWICTGCLEEWAATYLRCAGSEMGYKKRKAFGEE